jgi:hypothetical protein
MALCSVASPDIIANIEVSCLGSFDCIDPANGFITYNLCAKSRKKIVLRTNHFQNNTGGSRMFGTKSRYGIKVKVRYAPTTNITRKPYLLHKLKHKPTLNPAKISLSS